MSNILPFLRKKRATLPPALRDDHEPSEFQTPPQPQPLPSTTSPPSTPSEPPAAEGGTDIRRIKDRLAKLLRLGEDTAASDGEVENALRIASELMAKHQLTRDDIDTAAMDPLERIKIGEHFAFSKTRHLTLWEKHLQAFVCSFIGTVKAYISRNVPLRRNGIAMLDDSGNPRTGTILSFYGPADDAEVAAEMFTEIRDDIARMAVLRWGGWAKGDGAGYAYGFTQGLIQQHQAATLRLRENTDSQTTALILQSEKTSLAIREKATAWLAEQGMKITTSKSRSRITASSTAVAEGMADGKSYNPAKPTLRPKLQ